MGYYTPQLREIAIAAVRSGHSKKAVNEMFGLGINTLKSWEKLEAETGTFENRPLNRQARKINREELLKLWQDNPDATPQEIADILGVSRSGIRAANKALKITRKKRQYIIRSETNN